MCWESDNKKKIRMKKRWDDLSFAEIERDREMQLEGQQSTRKKMEVFEGKIKERLLLRKSCTLKLAVCCPSALSTMKTFHLIRELTC